MLAQLTSRELSELIAYSHLHPVSPGLETMLANIAHMVSVGGGVKVDDKYLNAGDFFVRAFLDEK